MKIAASLVQLPTGQLGLIERASRELHRIYSPTTFEGLDTQNQHPDFHPIQVKPVKRHFEVVGGFRAFHIACANLSSNQLIEVQEVDLKNDQLVERSLSELIANLPPPSLTKLAERRRLYLALRELSRSLKTGHTPVQCQGLSPKSLRIVLNLTPDQCERPRRRSSAFSQKLEAGHD